jgi:hypothetical protein
MIPAGTTAQTDNIWRGGVMLSLTTDFDVFSTVFSNYFSPAKYPTITPASP